MSVIHIDDVLSADFIARIIADPHDGFLLRASLSTRLIEKALLEVCYLYLYETVQ